MTDLTCGGFRIKADGTLADARLQFERLTGAKTSAKDDSSTAKAAVSSEQPRQNSASEITPSDSEGPE